MAKIIIYPEEACVAGMDWSGVPSEYEVDRRTWWALDVGVSEVRSFRKLWSTGIRLSRQGIKQLTPNLPWRHWIEDRYLMQETGTTVETFYSLDHDQKTTERWYEDDDGKVPLTDEERSLLGRKDVSVTYQTGEDFDTWEVRRAFGRKACGEGAPEDIRVRLYMGEDDHTIIVPSKSTRDWGEANTWSAVGGLPTYDVNVVVFAKVTGGKEIRLFNLDKGTHYKAEDYEHGVTVEELIKRTALNGFDTNGRTLELCESLRNYVLEDGDISSFKGWAPRKIVQPVAKAMLWKRNVKLGEGAWKNVSYTRNMTYVNTRGIVAEEHDVRGMNTSPFNKSLAVCYLETTRLHVTNSGYQITSVKPWQRIRWNDTFVGDMSSKNPMGSHSSALYIHADQDKFRFIFQLPFVLYNGYGNDFALPALAAIPVIVPKTDVTHRIVQIETLDKSLHDDVYGIAGLSSALSNALNSIKWTISKFPKTENLLCMDYYNMDELHDTMTLCMPGAAHVHMLRNTFEGDSLRAEAAMRSRGPLGPFISHLNDHKISAWSGHYKTIAAGVSTNLKTMIKSNRKIAAKRSPMMMDRLDYAFTDVPDNWIKPRGTVQARAPLRAVRL